MSEPIRLAQRLSQQLGCSRREAEHYIRSGFVRVDGQRVLLPQHRVTDEVLVLDTQAHLDAPLQVSLLFNLGPEQNPESLLASLSPENRWPEDPCELEPLPTHFYQQQLAMGLEPGIEGLVVFSQERGCLRKLKDDRNKLEQEFAVLVSGEMRENGLKRLNQPLNFNALGFSPCKVSWLSEGRLRFAVKNPKPGQIEHMCHSQGLEVTAIKRQRIGAQSLGKVPSGQWRYLLPGDRF